MKLHRLLAAFFVLSAISCGGSSSGSSDSSTGTSYSGNIIQSFSRTSARAEGLAALCVFTGPVNMTVYDDGTVAVTPGDAGTTMTGACQYVDEVVSMEWSGTAANGQFTMNATASGPHASLTADASGAYTDTAASGTGTGTVTVTGTSGGTATFSADYTFNLTAT